MVRSSSSPKSTSSRTLSASDWINAAMDAIVSGGITAVAVEPLAARLGTTKGSFYHHFDNRDALIVAALDDWERTQTEAVIERLDLIPDAADRLRAVLAEAFADREGGLRDSALLAAASHPLVKPIVKRVTDRRLRYFAERYAQLGMSRARAKRRAFMLYQSYIGLFDAVRLGMTDVSDAELRAHAHEVLSTLVP